MVGENERQLVTVNKRLDQIKKECDRDLSALQYRLASNRDLDHLLGSFTKDAQKLQERMANLCQNVGMPGNITTPRVVETKSDAKVDVTVENQKNQEKNSDLLKWFCFIGIACMLCGIQYLIFRT